MNEPKFAERLKNKIQERLGSSRYEVKTGKNLIYKIIVNPRGQFEPEEAKAPKRGAFAFQTDLLITMKSQQLPLVVIETKYNAFSTHDILTYSTKAQKHKEIYPYLRYGLVVGGIDIIQNRFFTHNSGFDFALALKRIDDRSLAKLIKIIKEQIKSAEMILDILTEKNRTRSFNTRSMIEKIKA